MTKYRNIAIGTIVFAEQLNVSNLYRLAGESYCFLNVKDNKYYIFDGLRNFSRKEVRVNDWIVHVQENIRTVVSNKVFKKAYEEVE